MACSVPTYSRDAFRITWLGFALNCFLGLLKCSSGYLIGSKALIADGVHSIADLSTDSAALVGLHWASQPEDENHLYGHHKYVSLMKLFIAALLFLFSALLCVSAIRDIIEPTLHFRHVGVGAAVAGLSIVLKEGLFWWTSRIARRVHSDLLRVNAWHHRMDSLSSIGVAVALLGIWLGGDQWVILDGLVTLLLGVFLVIQSSRIFQSSCWDLLDTAPGSETIKDLREHILPIEGAQAYHDFRVRMIGDFYEVDLHLQVNPDCTVEVGHEIAKEVKERIRRNHPEVAKVLVHVEPAQYPHLKDTGISDRKDSTQK